MEDINLISGRIVDAGYRIHKAIGPGLLESVYESVLARDLARSGYRVERQKPISFEFEGMTFTNVARTDLIVQGSVIVEIKSVETNARVHTKQLLTYLHLLDIRLGLLLNFGAPLMKDGIRRVINGYGEPRRMKGETQFGHAGNRASPTSVSPPPSPAHHSSPAEP